MESQFLAEVDGKGWDKRCHLSNCVRLALNFPHPPKKKRKDILPTLDPVDANPTATALLLLN
jgi:hypothetical protein